MRLGQASWSLLPFGTVTGSPRFYSMFIWGSGVRLQYSCCLLASLIWEPHTGMRWQGSAEAAFTISRIDQNALAIPASMLGSRPTLSYIARDRYRNITAKRYPYSPHTRSCIGNKGRIKRNPHWRQDDSTTLIGWHIWVYYSEYIVAVATFGCADWWIVRASGCPGRELPWSASSTREWFIINVLSKLAPFWCCRRDKHVNIRLTRA